MPRNACTNHPKRDVIEIPAGTRYCNRCHHLIPPEPKTTPAEVEVEAESPEEIEAVEEVAEEALEEILGEIVEEEEEPDRTELEAEPKGITSTVGDLDELAAALPEEPLEAESPPLSEIELKDIEESEKEYEAELKAEKAKKAEIARLEAELEELTK